MSGRTLAQGQAADVSQKSLHIILNFFHWPTVQNIHLHWASLKCALTASKHWTPSAATAVSIFNQYPPPRTQVCTIPHAHTCVHPAVCGWNTITITLQEDPFWQQAVRQSSAVTCQQMHSSPMMSALLCCDFSTFFNMIITHSSWILCSPSSR